LPITRLSTPFDNLLPLNPLENLSIQGSISKRHVLSFTKYGSPPSCNVERQIGAFNTDRSGNVDP
jgi:hypothetical protein